MKYRFGGHGFFAARRTAAAVLLMSAALPLAACTTASIDDVAPVTAASATAPQPLPPPTAPGAAGPALASVEDNAVEPVSGPRNTGAYPNLNITPGTAAEQLTPAQKAALLAELRAKQAKAAADVAKARPADQLDALTELGARHGDEVLKQIEAKSE